MQKKIILISLIAVTAIVALVSVGFYLSVSPHQKISASDVKEIIIWKAGNPIWQRVATQEEKEQIIEWFNSIESIERNPKRMTTFPIVGINIELISGQRVLMQNPTLRGDFEVQRDFRGKKVSYWAKQDDIKKLLKKFTR